MILFYLLASPKVRSLDVDRLLQRHAIHRDDLIGQREFQFARDPQVLVQRHDHRRFVACGVAVKLDGDAAVFARLDQARKEKLANGSPAAVSLQDLDAAHQAAQLAEVRLEIARRQQDYAEVMLDKATIAAPVAGMVLRILKHAGEGFVPGQGLIELGRVDHMQAVAEVYDSDVRFVAPGQRATFKSPALAKPAKGKVLRVQPLLDPVKLYETNAGASVENRVVHVIVDFGADPALTRMTGLQGIVSIDTAPVSGN